MPCNDHVFTFLAFFFLFCCHLYFLAGKVAGKSLWLGFFDRETIWDQTQVDKVKVGVHAVM